MWSCFVDSSVGIISLWVGENGALWRFSKPSKHVCQLNGPSTQQIFTAMNLFKVDQWWISNARVESTRTYLWLYTMRKIQSEHRTVPTLAIASDEKRLSLSVHKSGHDTWAATCFHTHSHDRASWSSIELQFANATSGFARASLKWFSDFLWPRTSFNFWT